MESSLPARDSLFDPRDLLQLLRAQHSSLPYRMTFLGEAHQGQALPQAVQTICRSAAGKPCCSVECHRVWQASLDKAQISKRPHIHTCPRNFMGFALPLEEDGEAVGFLLGGGLRKEATPPHPVAPLFRAEPPAMGHEERCPATTDTSTIEETRRFVEEIARELPHLMEKQLHPLGLARLTRNIDSLHLLAQEIAVCPRAEDAVGMTVEALAVWFDAPRVLIRIGHPETGGNLRAALGFGDGEIKNLEKVFPEVFDHGFSPAEGLTETTETLILDSLEFQSALLLPLQDGNRLLGIAILLDGDLPERDRTLCKLVLDRLSARLGQLKLEEDRQREKGLSAKLVQMITALSMVDSQAELYQHMLEMAVELSGAAMGSLMLFDETAAALKIVAAKGMSAPVAKSIVVPVGEGISGRVVQRGQPLMVNDIEKDERTAAPNRPRFRTKSFLCLPLKNDERVIGVLNLADKCANTSFSQEDLELLQSFTTPAVQMFERIAVLEQVGHLEKLSITDPLTGLYNRRFLKQRLAEEISRSQRQEEKFSLVLADLDNFKIYNDLLGHLAGDRALRKVAGVLRATAREMDIVTRFGGEEFCLLLPGTGKKECLFVAERLRRAIEAEIFPGESHLPLGSLTISLGVSAYPEDGKSSDQLLHAADLALYRAKHNGRNRLVLYQADLSPTLASVDRNE